MKCPNCGKEIETVNVYSQCVQKAEVDKEGKVIDYTAVEEVLETLGIECSECGADITEIIKED